MAFAVYTWPNGMVASSTGAHGSVSGQEVQTNRQALFVSSTHPNASNANAGTSPEAPWATIAYAITQAGSINYVIVVGANHAEELTATIAQAGLWIVGEGTGNNRPQLTASASVDSPIFTVTGSGVVLRNLIYIDRHQNEADRTGPLVTWNAAYGLIANSKFRMAIAGSTFGADIAMQVGAGAGAQYLEINACEFANEDANNSNNPSYAVFVTGANASGLRVIGCTFDGGTYGWDSPALALDNPSALTNFYVYGNTFQNYADCSVTTNASRGIMGGNTFNTGSELIVDVTSASLKQYPNGLVSASTDGNALLRARDLFTFGSRIFWVNSASATGADASGYGVKRGRPFLTLAYALTQTGTGQCDIVVLDIGHTEALASALTVSNTFVKVYGLGAGTSRPLLSLGVAGDLFTLSGAGVELHGLRFAASTLAVTTGRVVFTAGGGILEGCDFACGALDLQSVKFSAGGDGFRCENNTLTISAQGPQVGISVANAAISYCHIYNNQATGNTAYTWVSGWLQSQSAHGGGLFVYSNTVVTQANLEVIQTGAQGVWLAANVIDDTCEVLWS